MSDKYSVEYAKSGRSSCKRCKSAIEKDTIRIGTKTKMGEFDSGNTLSLDCPPSFSLMPCFSVMESCRMFQVTERSRYWWIFIRVKWYMHSFFFAFIYFDNCLQIFRWVRSSIDIKTIERQELRDQNWSKKSERSSSHRFLSSCLQSSMG